MTQLTGTEKQIAYAEKLKSTAFGRIEQVIAVITASDVRFNRTPERLQAHQQEKEVKLQKLNEVKQQLQKIESAKWWIDADPKIRDWSDIQEVERLFI